MDNATLKRSPGRPAQVTTPPAGAAVSDRVEAAPTADHQTRVEGSPAPTIDVTKTVQVAKPEKKVEVEQELKWFKVHIDIGPSTDNIKINDQTFHHGQIATVREDLLPVLNEVMYNTKMHERVVRGEVSPMGRRLQR